MIKFRRAGSFLLAVLMIVLPMPAWATTVSLLYPASDQVLINPYIGNMAWATDLSEHEQAFTLVYADVTWAALEPEKGAYDFESFEALNNIEHWRAQGVHVVLRFVMDTPGKKKHMDIPQWLYDATDGDGETYNTSYGRGYSPNYENPTLIRAHDRVIRALGERYGHDPLIAYVELGSLGHWGEWHVHDKLHDFPLMDVRAQYVAPYIEAFPEAALMMRRPFTHAAENGMGLFNDAAADLEATQDWLSWIDDGGDYDQTGEEDALVPMPDAWRSAPIGGELSPSYKRTDLLGDMFEQTKSLMHLSHASWIGPGSFVDIPRDGNQQSRLDELMKSIGYRLRVSRLDIADASRDSVRFTLTWHNDGIAPFYFPWQPALMIEGPDKERTIYQLDSRLIDIQPDSSYVMNMTLQKREMPQGECALYVGIFNPNTGDAAVLLAMDIVPDSHWYPLGRIAVR